MILDMQWNSSGVFTCIDMFSDCQLSVEILCPPWTWVVLWTWSSLPCRPEMQSTTQRYMKWTFCQWVKNATSCHCGVMCQRFAAVIMRIREPRTTALIFSSGKMVCTGAKRSVLQQSGVKSVFASEACSLTSFCICSWEWGAVTAGGQEICPSSSETGLPCSISGL